MLFTALEKENIIERNRQEYGSVGRFMEFIDPVEVERLTRQRALILDRLDRFGVTRGANGTKLDMRRLSPGCRICVEGGWSCLFINNLCNASCFYCPSAQKDLAVPATNHLTFDDPGFYARYLQRFGFSGASISGGEPFLTFEKSLDYIQKIREVNGPGFHIWMYTNGILSTPARLARLAKAGLNELRFDLTAVGYDTRKAAQATGIIETVTVEIPAIEGELEPLKTMAGELCAAGVRHLNLHQLRCTPFSVSRMIERGIAFIHAPFVLSARSEVVALELLAYTLESGIDLPVNFCSFLYKYHSQNGASRRRGAGILPDPLHSVTPAGYLRELSCGGAPVSARELRDHAHEDIQLDYFESRISQDHPAGETEVFSHGGRSLYVQKRRALISVHLQGDEVEQFRAPFLNDRPWGDEQTRAEMGRFHGTAAEKFSAIRAMEILPEGSIEYF